MSIERLLINAKNDYDSPLRLQLGDLCEDMYESVKKGTYGEFTSDPRGSVTSIIIRASKDRIRERFQKTFASRKRYYSSSPLVSFYPCSKYGNFVYKPVKIPFRYIEEIVMVFSLIVTSIEKNPRKYSILYKECKKVFDGLATLKLLPTQLQSLFRTGTSKFDQKKLTKFSYELGKSGEVPFFFKTFISSLEKSQVMMNLFTLVYEYLMSTSRDMIVEDVCAPAHTRYYKFTFDSFYWSKSAFESVVKSTPRK